MDENFDAADTALVRAGRHAFGPGFAVRAVARLGSTQDAIRAAARAGAAAGACCVAGEQTAGRGRQGRRWEASPGGALLTSILLRPRGPLGWLPLAAGLAVVEALREATGVETRLKWPNDVLATDGGKLAGLLAEVESAAPSTGEPAVVLGVGLNIRVHRPAQGAVVASLHALMAPAHPPRREALLAALLRALPPRLAQVAGGHGGSTALHADWERAAVGLGDAVRVAVPWGEVRGRAQGLDDAGALLVTEANGRRHRLLAGDVHLIGDEDARRGTAD